MSDMFVRERPVKKHTRSVKETLIIYAIGVFVCVYFGFLLGAVWMDGKRFSGSVPDSDLQAWVNALKQTE